MFIKIVRVPELFIEEISPYPGTGLTPGSILPGETTGQLYLRSRWKLLAVGEEEPQVNRKLRSFMLHRNLLYWKTLSLMEIIDMILLLLRSQ
jgi:hypothetical protein